MAEALELLEVGMLKAQLYGEAGADVLSAREERQHRDAFQHRALAGGLLQDVTVAGAN